MSANPDGIWNYIERAYHEKIVGNPSFNDSIDVPQVTPQELETTTVDDDSVGAVWAAFSSAASKRYLAVHVPHHPDGPYILLSSPDKDEADFKVVEGDVVRVVNGKPEGRIGDRGNDISDVIQLRQPFAGRIVASSVTRLKKAFPDLTIIHAFFHLVNFHFQEKETIFTPTSLGQRLGVQPSVHPYSKGGPWSD